MTSRGRAGQMLEQIENVKSDLPIPRIWIVWVVLVEVRILVCPLQTFKSSAHLSVPLPKFPFHVTVRFKLTLFLVRQIISEYSLKSPLEKCLLPFSHLCLMPME